jgi:NAD+-processing family protein with receiver domain
MFFLAVSMMLLAASAYGFGIRYEKYRIKKTVRLKVYLDDCRPGPASHPVTDESVHDIHDDWPDWIIVRGIKNLKLLLEMGMVGDLSLDHDLGTIQDTGYQLCLWMAETGNWPKGHIWVHSANPVGAKNMVETIKRYRPTTVAPEDFG